MTIGLSFAILAALCQGLFLLPMSRTRDWKWEHSWLAFSATGMVLCNWVLALLLLPSPWAIYAAVPRQEILTLVAFGIVWGVSAVMFGMGMDMLGLTLGYPLMMGLNASVGTVIPLLWFNGQSMQGHSGAIILSGTAVAIAGIAICSVAGARKASVAQKSHPANRSRFVSGLIVAVASGTLSCLPNIGLAYAGGTLHQARALGASPAFAADSVWLLFFTCGGLVNVLYCLFLTVRNGNMRALVDKAHASNWIWGVAMGSLWIASFYLYGISTARMGTAGASIAWPIFIALSIGVGVLVGLSKGEWKGASNKARILLWEGMALIALAVVIIPLGNHR
jgi:L-rhamnose-H+ transport protein